MSDQESKYHKIGEYSKSLRNSLSYLGAELSDEVVFNLVEIYEDMTEFDRLINKLLIGKKKSTLLEIHTMLCCHWKYHIDQIDSLELEKRLEIEEK